MNYHINQYLSNPLIVFLDACLFSVWHSRVHYSATRTSFATIFDVSESPIHSLSYAVPFVSIIIVVVEKNGGKVQGQPLKWLQDGRRQFNSGRPGSLYSIR